MVRIRGRSNSVDVTTVSCCAGERGRPSSRPGVAGRRAVRGRHLVARVAMLAVALLVGACAEVGSRPDAVVTGTVLATASTVLPPDARLRITLLAELAEGVLDPVAEVEVDTPRLPYAFTLAYDARAIDPARRHLVQAQVTGNGMLMLLTVDEHPVVTLGNPADVRLVLAPAGG